MKKIWNIGIYVRVSTDKIEQQESIPVQIESLKKWIVQKSQEDREIIYNLVEIYRDEGFSGSTFNRKAFIKLKTDIENEKINMVIIRDLSRLGRNYIIAGYYIEEYFKTKDVRLISILDNVDTLEEGNDIVPFKNILNEMYIKDCSRRIRDGLRQRMLRGSSIASKPPYGYKFQKVYDKGLKNIKLIPREDITTEVVREIYSLYIQGWGMGKIAAYLNNKGIKPPCIRVKNFSKTKLRLWTNNTIRYILTNPKYAGIMAQGRWKKVSYKVKKVRYARADEWIIGGEFQGIISKEMFYKVQELIKIRRKTFRYKGSNIHLFSSILKCNECGGSMCYRAAYRGYKCTNSQIGGGRCTAHSIKEEYLKEIIKNQLKNYIEIVDKEKLYNWAIGVLKSRNSYKKDIKKIEEELKNLEWQIKSIYKDKLNGIINDRNFRSIMKNIQDSQDELIKRKSEIEKLNSINQNEESFSKEIKGKVDEILTFENFDKNIIETLIDKIVVFQKDTVSKKSIDIYFKFSK